MTPEAVTSGGTQSGRARPDGGPAPAAGTVDLESFEELDSVPVSRDPLAWPGYPQTLSTARDRTGHLQAVTAGTAVVRGQRFVLAAFDFGFLGGSMGEAEGELLVRAIGVAAEAGLPFVTVSRSGGARMQEGTLALLQMPRIARAVTELARAGCPHVAIVDDPTTGGVWASLVAGADVVIAKSGAQTAFAGSRVLKEEPDDAAAYTAEGKYECGFVDAVTTDASHTTQVLAGYLQLLAPATRGAPTPPPLPHEPDHRGGEPTNGWGSVRAARAEGRRTAEAHLNDYFDSRASLHGDRTGGVSADILCGFGRRDGRTLAFVCQRGLPVTATGFRTAVRLLQLAERCAIPVVTFIDTPGADNSSQAERSGIGTAIAQCLRQVAASSVPILSVVVGQGVSGGAISLVNPGNTWMAPASYLAVIAPESAAAILKADPSYVPALADQLGLSPAALRDLGVTRGLLPAS